MNQNNNNKTLYELIFKLINIIIILVIVLIGVIIVSITGLPDFKSNKQNKIINISSDNTVKKEQKNELWVAPDTLTIPANDTGKLIKYGHSLIVNTSYYFGPKGTVANISNGMNCQNCHLDAGTKLYGNNYSAVASTYPKYRARSGSIESIEKRVNDCLVRSLNGKALAYNSKEMKAIKAYINWLGKEVKKGDTPLGAGLVKLSYLNRMADTVKGKTVFKQMCVTCHGENGKGRLANNTNTFKYPPLWGEQSYNIGAGLYRLSSFARYIKANMPSGTNYDKPTLTDEQAWDVAAYVNSMLRPEMDISKDWQDISKKPIDYPFPPFNDNYSTAQHKYGPFKEIENNKNVN